MFYRDKLVLVTGGTGFVGSHLVDALLKAGAKVRVPVHKRPLLLTDPRIEVRPVDLVNQEDCLAATAGIDYVFHAAGAVSGAAVKGSPAMAGIVTNLTLTANILQAAWTNQVKRVLIFGSSTGYPVTDYPIPEEEMWSAPPPPSYFGYGWMRRYLERLGEFVTSQSTTQVVVVRPTALYGPGDNFDLTSSHVIPALIRKAVERFQPYEVWGTGEEIRDFLHVGDLAKGCLLMLAKNPQEALNIGYGQGIKIKDVVQIILKYANYPEAQVIFNSSKPTTIPYRMVDITKAKHLLGFEPTIILEEGLKETVTWYSQHIS